MGYLQQSMLPDEQLLYHTKKHFIFFFQPFLWTCATLFLLSVDNPYVNKAAFVFGAISAFYWISKLLDYYVSEFYITNKRILMREGFFIRHINETRLATISNVNIDQNILGQILNYGTVIIKTFGGDDDPFMEIPKPFVFRKVLQMQLDKIVNK